MGEIKPFFLTKWEREDYEREQRGESPHGPIGAPPLLLDVSNLPLARGIGRMADNDRAIILTFDRRLTDDEMRVLHDHLYDLKRRKG